MTASRWQSLHYIWTVQIVQIQKNTVFCVSPLSTDTDTAICQVSTDVKCNMQLQTVNHMHIPPRKWMFRSHWGECAQSSCDSDHKGAIMITETACRRNLQNFEVEASSRTRERVVSLYTWMPPTRAAFSVQPKTTLTARRVMAGCPWEFEWPQEPRVRSWQKQGDDLGCSDLLAGLGRNDGWKDV